MDVHSTVLTAKEYGDSSDEETDAINDTNSKFGAYLYPQRFQDNSKVTNYFIINFIIK